MTNAKILMDELNDFFDAESIKDFFIVNGIKGYRQDESSCPISVWLRNNLNCSVSTEDTIKVYNGEWGTFDQQYEEFETSDVVKTFITNFDCGQWPELEIEDVDYNW